MSKTLKNLILALEQAVSPQTQPKVKWAVKDITDCEGTPGDCPPDNVGACCLPGGGFGSNQCLDNLMKDACESQGGTFYANKTCGQIGGDNCGTAANQTTETAAPSQEMSATPPAQ
jgi:hypothetical protein